MTNSDSSEENLASRVTILSEAAWNHLQANNQPISFPVNIFTTDLGPKVELAVRKMSLIPISTNLLNEHRSTGIFDREPPIFPINIPGDITVKEFLDLFERKEFKRKFFKYTGTERLFFEIFSIKEDEVQLFLEHISIVKEIRADAIDRKSTQKLYKAMGDHDSVILIQARTQSEDLLFSCHNSRKLLVCAICPNFIEIEEVCRCGMRKYCSDNCRRNEVRHRCVDLNDRIDIFDYREAGTLRNMFRDHRHYNNPFG